MLAEHCWFSRSRELATGRPLALALVGKRLAEIGTKRSAAAAEHEKKRHLGRRAQAGAPELPPSRDRAADRICISNSTFPACGAEQVSKQVREQAIRFALEQHESSRSHQQPHGKFLRPPADAASVLLCNRSNLCFSTAVTVHSQGDNQSSIQVAHLPGKHSSSLRHLELRAFAIRSLIDAGELNAIWCSTDDQCSDLLTKPLGKEKYDKFSAILLGERTNSEVKRALISRFVTEFAADVSARNASRQAPPSGRTTGSALGGCVWAGATQPLSGSAGAQPRPGSRAPFGLPA